MSISQKPPIVIIADALNQPTIDWQQVLTKVISHYNCSTGTLHFLEKDMHFLVF